MYRRLPVSRQMSRVLVCGLEQVSLALCLVCDTYNI